MIIGSLVVVFTVLFWHSSAQSVVYYEPFTNTTVGSLTTSSQGFGTSSASISNTTYLSAPSSLQLSVSNNCTDTTSLRVSLPISLTTGNPVSVSYYVYVSNTSSCNTTSLFVTVGPLSAVNQIRVPCSGQGVWIKQTQCGIIAGPNSSLTITFDLTAPSCTNFTVFIDDITVTTIPPLDLTCPGPTQVTVNGTGCGCAALQNVAVPTTNSDPCKQVQLTLNSNCVPYGSSLIVWTASRNYFNVLPYNYDVSTAQTVPLLVLASNQVAHVYSSSSVTPCSGCPQVSASGLTSTDPNNIDPKTPTYALMAKIGSGAWAPVSTNPNFDGPGTLYLDFNRPTTGWTPGSGSFATTITVSETATCNQTILRPLYCPDIVVPCAGNGTIVNYTNSSLTCNPSQCSVPSGSLFPVGNTTVVCTSMGLNCTFTVSVLDTVPPNITCPSSVYQKCGNSSNYYFSGVSATDNCGLASNPVCNVPFNSSLTSANVNCSVYDMAGNFASCSFNVSIQNSSSTYNITVNDVDTYPTGKPCRGSRHDSYRYSWNGDFGDDSDYMRSYHGSTYCPYRMCSNPNLLPFNLSMCVTAVDACYGNLNITNIGNITRIQLLAYRKLGCSSYSDYEQVRNLRSNFRDDVCPRLSFSGSNAYLPTEGLSNQVGGAAYNVSFVLNLPNGTKYYGSCYVNAFASRTLTPRRFSGCATCVGSGCGSCPAPSSLEGCRNTLAYCKENKSYCSRNPNSKFCKKYNSKCTIQNC